MRRASGAALLRVLDLAAAIAEEEQRAAEDAAAAAEPDPDLPAPVTVLEWAERYRQLEGRPFNLDAFEPLKAIYADDCPHIVVIKPAQRGISEWAINLASYALDRGADVWTHGRKEGLNIGYIFPTKEALSDFSKERFSGLKRESDYLESIFSGEAFNAVTFKQVRNSYLYLRGGWSESALMSFPCDLMILDEYDEITPGARVLARKRMNASMVRREVDISTPTIPGRGIDAMYKQSDQRYYEQPCSYCGTWNEYDFFRDVRVGGAEWETWKLYPAIDIRRLPVTMVCPSCKAELSDTDRCAPGRWKALAPEITSVRGYKIPPLAFPFVSLEEFAVSAVDPDPEVQKQFYRADLGMPYDLAGSRVTPSMLGQLSHGLPGGLLPIFDRWRRTTMGVDIGSRLHFRISATGPDNQRYVRAMGAVREWSDLSILMAQYRVRNCVIDALPEGHKAKEWAAEFPGRVLRAFYPTEAALPGKLWRAHEKDGEIIDGEIQINRTMAMDLVFATIARGDEHWPAAIHNNSEVVSHLTQPVRVVVDDKRGQARATWEHVGPDHFYHACVYDLIAEESLPDTFAVGVVQGSAKRALPIGRPMNGHKPDRRTVGRRF